MSFKQGSYIGGAVFAFAMVGFAIALPNGVETRVRRCLTAPDLLALGREGVKVRRVRLFQQQSRYVAKLTAPDGLRTTLATSGDGAWESDTAPVLQTAADLCTAYAFGLRSKAATQARLRAIGMDAAHPKRGLIGWHGAGDNAAPAYK